MTDDNEYMYAVDYMRRIFVSYTLLLTQTTTDVVETIPYCPGVHVDNYYAINDTLSVQ